MEQTNSGARLIKRRPNGRSEQALADEINGLASLEIEAFKQKWIAIFGAEPPPGLSRTFLVRALAYRIQEQVFGGLKPALKKYLRELAEPQADQRAPIAPQAGSIHPGTVLIRQWHGVTHRVIALENGFEWKERRYRSLSELAREISGTRWSGPRFFGLKARAEVSDG